MKIISFFFKLIFNLFIILRRVFSGPIVIDGAEGFDVTRKKLNKVIDGEKIIISIRKRDRLEEKLEIKEIKHHVLNYIVHHNLKVTAKRGKFATVSSSALSHGWVEPTG